MSGNGKFGSRLLPRRLLGLVLAGALPLVAGCGGTPKNTVNLTFFQAATVTPLIPVAGQNYVVNFNLFNADEQNSTIANVQYSVSRNNVVIKTGTIPQLASHVPVGINLTDNEPSGLFTYVLTIDPNDLIPEIDKTDNTLLFQLKVVPLSVM
jgi:hypothetical protein